MTEELTQVGGRAVGVWRASALTLIDGQTKALGIAARVAADPAELPVAVAELLGARYLGPGADPGPPGRPETALELAQGDSVLRFVRTGEPFTPAETARAHRLCDLATSVRRA